MADALATPSDARGGPDRRRQRLELRREAQTMAFYVAICLLGYLTTFKPSDTSETELLEGIWGVTIGLALAHWFAFGLATRVVRAGEVRHTDLELVAAQLGGAVGVAILTSIPVVLSPSKHQVVVAEFVLVGLIASAGFLSVWGSGGRLARSFLFAAIALAVAAAVVMLKNSLYGY